MKGVAHTKDVACTECNHKHYKNPKYNDRCPNCNCGESEQITPSYNQRRDNPNIAYHGNPNSYNPYERAEWERGGKMFRRKLID